MLEVLTPTNAFEMYRGNIEEYDDPVPMLALDMGSGTDLVLEAILDQEVTDALQGMVNDGLRFQAILLSSWAKMQAFDPDGNALTEGPVDAAAFVYVDAQGREWSASRPFVRINGTVTYLTELQVFTGKGEGTVSVSLRTLVGQL
jgi:hypothetical protein